MSLAENYIDLGGSTIDLGNPQFFAELLATPPIENPDCGGESSEFSSVTQMDADNPINYNIATFSQPEFEANNICNFSGMFMFLGLYYIIKKGLYDFFFAHTQI